MTTPGGMGTAVPAPEGRAQFFGTKAALASLIVKSFFLQIITLGIYRFWFVTRRRQHFWENTEVDRSALEYTGTGRELLIGFLVALAALAPLWITHQVLISFGVWNPFAVTGVVILIFMLLAYFATYRARRYRLTRTLWRGVRWWQDGSGWAYACRAFGWDIIKLLSLGLAAPYAHASLERYMMRHTHYGDVTGAFEGRGGVLFARWAPIWCISAIPAFALLAIGLSQTSIPALVAYFEELGLALASETQPPSIPSEVTMALGALVWTGITNLLLYPWRYAIRFRWWADGVRLGDTSMQSNLSAAAIYGNWARYIGFTFGGFLLLMVIALVVALLFVGGAAIFSGGSEEGMVVGGIIAGIVIYAVIFLAMQINYELMILRRLWVQLWQSLEFRNIGKLKSQQAQVKQGSGFGEGLVDALDAGGF